MMSAKLAKPRAAAKSGRFPKGNQIFPEGNRISPVMQKVRGSLRPVKAAQELVFLTGEPLSICQKTLTGHRCENRELLLAMMRTRLITDVVIAATAGATDPDAKALRKLAQKLELQRKLREIEEGE
jgi:hypothetical protein